MTELFRFVTGSLPGAPLPATYDGWLVALSYLVAALASYTAIDLADRVREFRTEPRKAAAWLTGGALAMGAGIWSMHFVAMLAYQLPVPVRYDWSITLASMVVAVVTSGFALFIVTHFTLTLARLALSGAVMGAGIGAMHYVGMAAMRLDALVMYYAGPFAISVANAIVCSTAALWLVARRAEAGLQGRILAALVMGVAVAGMHYTGMYATVCVATDGTASVAGGLDAALLAVVITVITLLIMGMALAVSLQSQLLSRTLRRQNLLLLEEIAQKRRVEGELQAHRDNLQLLIDERTRDLSRANADIRQNERRFRATFEHAAVGIAHTSLDGVYLLVNRKFGEMLGYDESELIGRSAAEQSHPEDRGHFGRQRHVMLSGQCDSVNEHKRYVRKDGSVLWTQRTVSLARGEAGEPLYFIRVIEDITERMQAENAIAQERALLRTIVDSLPDFIFVKDAEGRIQLANDAWLKDRGLASSDVIGKTVFDIYPRGMAEAIAAQDAAVLHTGVPILNQERPIVAADADGRSGPMRWGFMTKVPMRDAAGAIFGTVGISRDITRQKLMTQCREMEYAVTRLLAEATSAETAMPKLIQTLCEAAGWSYGAHWNRCDSGDALMLRERWSDFSMGFDEAERQRWQKISGTNTNGLISRAWREKQPHWIEDLENDTAFARRDIALRFGLRSAFSFPVIAGDTAIGVMEFFAREVRQPDETLLQAASSIGQQIGQFIQRKLAEAALQGAHAELEARVRDRTLDLEQVNTTLRSEIEQKRRVEAELQAHRNNLQSLIDERTAELEQSNQVLAQRTDEVLRITRMSNLLQTASDMREAGEILSRMMQPLVAPHAGAIYLTAASLNRLDRLTCWGGTPYASAIAPDECWGLRRGGIYSANHAQHDMYCAHVHADAQHQPYLCVPMMAHGVSLGLLHISFARDSGCTQSADAERLRVQRIADQVTLALANVKLRQSLREQSIRDLLTGLFNRRYLEESLDREIARASREQTPLALIMLDVDHFKRFNDQYGHEGGDAVLQMLGRVLHDAARASDIVARYGGEEFTVLLPNASPEGARQWAERLRETVRGMEVQCGGQTFPPITISLGLAMRGDNGATGEQLLRAADIALYDAKRRGRDRLVVASPLTLEK